MPKSVVPWPMAKREFQAQCAWVSTSNFQIHPACLPLNSPRKCPNDLITTQAFVSSLCQRMTWYTKINTVTKQQRCGGMLFICLILLMLWWDSELDYVCVYVSPCCVSNLSLAWADVQRLAGAKWFARNIDLTRSLHHTLMYVTIIQTANSASVIQFTTYYWSSHCGIDGHLHTKAALPEQTPLNNCFYFGTSTLWSTSSA